MGTATYTNFNGVVVSENRSGLPHDYLHDPLGNTIALLAANQAITDTWTHWP